VLFQLTNIFCFPIFGFFAHLPIYVEKLTVR